LIAKHFCPTNLTRRCAAGTFSLAALALFCWGCEGKRYDVLYRKREEGDDPNKGQFLLQMGDSSAANRLPNGFYAVENNAWRWTAGNFSAVLDVPKGADRKGAIVYFNFAVPDELIAAVKDVTLTASVGGSRIGSTKYTAGGPYIFKAEISSLALSGTSVTVRFDLDKHAPPGPVEKRPLGVIANSLRLTAR
jgi:hypothetical protein